MPSLPKIIGFVGKKKSGKDTALALLRELYPHQHFVRCAFADELKKEIARACGVTVEYIDQHKEVFRTILQWWGTEWRRRHSGNDNYWIDVWEKKVNYILMVNPDSIIVTTDVRFLNEAKCIKDCGGKLIFILPEGKEMPVDSHSSETELQEIVPDAYVRNDFKAGLSVLRAELSAALAN